MLGSVDRGCLTCDLDVGRSSGARVRRRRRTPARVSRPRRAGTLVFGTGPREQRFAGHRAGWAPRRPSRCTSVTTRAPAATLRTAGTPRQSSGSRGRRAPAQQWQRRPSACRRPRPRSRRTHSTRTRAVTGSSLATDVQARRAPRYCPRRRTDFVFVQPTTTGPPRRARSRLQSTAPARPRRLPRGVSVDGVAVRPNQQSRGIDPLIDALELRIVRRGRTVATLKVETDNSPIGGPVPVRRQHRRQRRRGELA